MRLVTERLLPIVVFPFLLVLLLFFVFIILPGNQQYAPQPIDPGLDNNGRRQAIKSAFRWSWDGYHRHAFPQDELRPVTNSAGNSRNGWGATAIDALGTAILMEEWDIVEVIVSHVRTIDFHRTDTPISVFESTIRYMGGMLSAYELLTGPFMNAAPDMGNLSVLVEQAVSLGEVLSHAFDDGYTLPSGALDPHTLKGNGRNSLAGAGTLALEWTKLSELSKIGKFAALAQATEDALIHPPSSSDVEPFPGLVGTDIDISSAAFLPSMVTWGGSSDSFLEYLLKLYVYDPVGFSEHRDRWVLAADSTIKYLGSSPEAHPDILFLGSYDGKAKKFVPVSGHLECFAGGNFLLGGLVLNVGKYTEFGLRLIDGCRHTYVSTKTQIGPEKFSWIPVECNTHPSPLWNCQPPPDQSAKDFSDRNQFWIIEGSYNLRPEVLESYYYAYRVTKDTKYRDWAWEAWLAIDKTARLESGYNYLRDVDAEDGSKFEGNNQESYFFSETLKYLFLIFSDDGDWHFNRNGSDLWVYSTEGHPLRVQSPRV